MLLSFIICLILTSSISVRLFTSIIVSSFSLMETSSLVKESYDILCFKPPIPPVFVNINTKTDKVLEGEIFSDINLC